MPLPGAVFQACSWHFSRQQITIFMAVLLRSTNNSHGWNGNEAPLISQMRWKNVIIFRLMCCGIASSKLGIISDWVKRSPVFIGLSGTLVKFHTTFLKNYFTLIFYSTIDILKSSFSNVHHPRVSPTHTHKSRTLRCNTLQGRANLYWFGAQPVEASSNPSFFLSEEESKFHFCTRGGKELFHASLTPLFFRMVVFSFF